jgi:hypothetical protein
MPGAGRALLADISQGSNVTDGQMADIRHREKLHISHFPLALMVGCVLHFTHRSWLET